MIIGWAEWPVFQLSGRCFKAVTAADKHFAFVTNKLNHLAVFNRMVFPDLCAIGIDVGLILRSLEPFRNELDRAGMIHAKRPLDDVEMMRAPVAIFTRAIIPKASPTAAVVSLDPLLVIRIPGRG